MTATEILIRDPCDGCSGAGCETCGDTGKIERWAPVEEVARLIDAEVTREAYSQQFRDG